LLILNGFLVFKILFELKYVNVVYMKLYL